MTFPDAQPLISSAESRPDFDIIVRWVMPGARVLDLGCGEGELMERLIHQKGVTAQGVDLHQPSVTACISKGLSVFHGDLHEGLADLRDQSFDFVILSRTLQQVPDPDKVIRAMLRVGAKAIVSFPNFAYWRCRMQMLFKGKVPVTKQLPFEWHNSPNIHLLSLKDFDEFCARLSVKVEKKIPLGKKRLRPVRFMPNIFAEQAIYVTSKNDITHQP